MKLYRDKLTHFGAGFIVTFLFGLLHPIAGQVACLAAAWFKEEYDRKRPANHTRDGWDAFATLAGSPPAMALLPLFWAGWPWWVALVR